MNILIPKKIKIIFSIFLIIIAVTVSFYPVLRNNFTNWDDNLYVTENKAIRSIAPANLKKIVSSFFITHYQPVTIFSYLLEYRFFKLNPFHYHLTNLVLHFLNCLLVFWLIYLVSGKIWISSLTALLFGIHPLQVESVAWISERKNLLYGFFFLGSMVSYFYYLRKEKKLKYYFICLGLFILALLSKSMALTLPLVLLLLDCFTFRKIDRAWFIEKIPHFFLSLLFGLVALWGGHLVKVFHNENSYGLFTRLMGAWQDMIFYFHKLCLPVKLSVLYPYSEIKNNPIYLYFFIAVIFLLIVIIIAKGDFKKIIFGCGFFLLTIFPVLRFFPLEEVLVADRYVYLPAIGVFYLFAEGFAWLYLCSLGQYRVIKVFLVAILAAILIFLGCSTWKRTQVWQNSLSLWSDVLKNYPNIFSAYNKRGEYFLSQGEYEKARLDFNQAVEISNRYPFNPGYKYYYLNLGNSLRVLGKNSEALAVFDKLIAQAQAYPNLGELKHSSGNPDEIIAANRKAIEAEVYFNLANFNEALGENDKAIALYLRTIEIYPKNASAHYYLGVLYFKLSRKEESALELLKSIEVDPTYSLAYIKLAQIYKALGQKEKLELIYKQAIANNADFFDAYYYVGNLYWNAQKDKQAILLYLKATEINPGSQEACVALGNSYLTIGRNKEAIIWLKKALKFNSNLAVAHNNLALAYYYVQEYDLAIKHSDQAGELGYSISQKLLELLKPYRK